MEDLVEALVTGKDRFYVRANKPYVESVAALGKGLFASFGRIHLSPPGEPHKQEAAPQRKSRTWGTPDGSAFHPVANETSPLWERPTQRAISADGVPDDFTLSETAMPRKGAPFFSTGGVVLFCASPLSGERWQSGSGPFCRRGENLPFRRVPRLEKGVGMKC